MAVKKRRRTPRAPNMVMVGTYPLDGHPVRVQLEWERENAYCHTCPTDEGASVFGIGCDHGRHSSADILDRVIHEAMEFMLLSRGIGYEPWGESGIDMSNRVFIITHQHLQASVHYLAHFLDKALPDVFREFRAMKKAHGGKP